MRAARVGPARNEPLFTTVNRRLLPVDPLEAITVFEEGKAPVHKTLSRLIKRLKKAKIDYVVVGGMAIDAHGHHRLTNDVDVLMTPEGLELFRRLFVPKAYGQMPERTRRFVDRVNKITLDILITGGIPGRGHRTEIRFPDPRQVGVQIGGVRYIALPSLIQLKLAARRHQDFADVVSLIRVHNLNETFLKHLHQTLHRDFIECLEEHRRELEYEARQ